MSRIPGWTKVSKAVGWALAHQIQYLSLALRFVLFAGVAVCAQHAELAWAGVIHHVKADATGAKNGQSWADAYTDLQAGLAAAEWGDEIWVAQGTYKPTTGTLRTVSFVLEAGVGLYGGFAGAETALGQRDWTTNATVLSGNIGTAGSAADNSYHVVTGADLAVLDGFTITGGDTYVSGSSNYGGGMYNDNCSPTLANCTFSGNWASSGGGMYNHNSSPTVTNCTFSDNTASGYFGGGNGGGMHNESSSPTVTSCMFSDNRATSGGGMYNSDDSSPTLTNCTFSGNTTSDGGAGGGMGNWNSSPTVTNCTFSGNWAMGGGGMCNSSSSPNVTNCTFSGNTTRSDGYGGGMYNVNCSPTVTNCTFSGNTTGNGGGMHNQGSSPTVTNCTFSSNTATYGGGGMINESSSPDVTNCTFSSNTASGTYGSGGGGMYNYSGSPTVANCIFWDNSAPLGAEILKNSGTPAFSHCDIKGCGGSGAWDAALGTDGGGNIAADPRFLAPATPAGADGLWRTRDDGLRLRSNSPCIGAADPAVAPQKDILGLRRNTIPDIGAYEYYPIVPATADPVWRLFR